MWSCFNSLAWSCQWNSSLFFISSLALATDWSASTAHWGEVHSLTGLWVVGSCPAQKMSITWKTWKSAVSRAVGKLKSMMKLGKRDHSSSKVFGAVARHKFYFEGIHSRRLPATIQKTSVCLGLYDIAVCLKAPLFTTVHLWQPTICKRDVLATHAASCYMCSGWDVSTYWK